MTIVEAARGVTGGVDTQLEGAEVAQPVQQLLVATFGRGEARDSEQGAPLV